MPDVIPVWLTMRYWMIRNPYKHHNWEDVLFRDSYSLYGIKGRYAQKLIASMLPDDKAIYYDPHKRSCMGVLEVAREPFQDFTACETQRLCVDFKPIKTLAEPVVLSVLKDSFLFHANPSTRLAPSHIRPIKTHKPVVECPI